MRVHCGSVAAGGRLDLSLRLRLFFCISARKTPPTLLILAITRPVLTRNLRLMTKKGHKRALFVAAIRQDD